MRHRIALAITWLLAVVIGIALAWLATGCSGPSPEEEMISRARRQLGAVEEVAARAGWAVHPVGLGDLFGEMAAGGAVPDEPLLGSGGPVDQPATGQGGPSTATSGGPGAPSQPSGGPAPGPTVTSGDDLSLAGAVCDLYAALCAYLQRCAAEATGDTLDFQCDAVFLSGRCEQEVASAIAAEAESVPSWAASFVGCLASAIRSLPCAPEEVDPLDLEACLPADVQP
jgi:hypothetical protein